MRYISAEYVFVVGMLAFIVIIIFTDSVSLVRNIFLEEKELRLGFVYIASCGLVAFIAASAYSSIKGEPILPQPQSGKPDASQKKEDVR